jgi:hypothetical protein
MLDNGYVYLAACRLSLFGSPEDWALAIEIFGYSPRSGIPDIHVYTIGSRVRRIRTQADYVSTAAYEAYLASNPNNESAFIYPIEEGDWQNPSNDELLAHGQHYVSVRGHSVVTPPSSEYAKYYQIALAATQDVHVFEFCLYIAASMRDSVLATPDERRVCVPSDLVKLLQVEEWRHPDLLKDERPSEVAMFQLFAEILAGNHPARYELPEAPNTHWSNWPEGGSL